MLNILNMFSGEPWFSDVKRYFLFFNNENDDTKYHKKIENAKKEYSNIENNEPIVFLFDDTVFGSAKKGFFFTHKKVYCDAFTSKEGIRLNDIDSISVSNPINRKIFLKNSNCADMNYIHFTTKDDKFIQGIVLPFLSKYILISRLVAVAGEDHNESEVLNKAFKIASDPKNLESFSKTEQVFLKELKPISQTKDAKSLYKEKIISGEIDPSELSFEDFKEQLKPDLKALYKEKIASGEIDPTEISFEEFKQSLKPDLKALYKEKIASGEIDPTEISFEEFRVEYDDEEEQCNESYEDDISSTVRLDSNGRLLGGEIAIGKFNSEKAKEIQEAYNKTNDADEFYDKFVEIIGADSGEVYDIITATPDNICHENTPWMQEDEPIDFKDVECEQGNGEGHSEIDLKRLVSFNNRSLENGIYSMVFWGGKSFYSINVKNKNIDEIVDGGMKYLAHSIELSFGMGANEDGADTMLSPEGDETYLYLPQTFWQNTYEGVADEYEIEENGDELEVLDDYVRKVVIFKVDKNKVTRLFVKDLTSDGEVFFK